MIPLAIGSDHLLCLIDATLALGAAVLVVLLSLDHPRLDGAPRQHVILVVVELAEVLGPRAQALPPVPRAGLGAEVAWMFEVSVRGSEGGLRILPA